MNPTRVNPNVERKRTVHRGKCINNLRKSAKLAVTEKNGFVTATKLGTTNNCFAAATKNFAAATKRFGNIIKHFVVTKYFCYPYFNKFFFWYNKTFFPCGIVRILSLIHI